MKSSWEKVIEKIKPKAVLLHYFPTSFKGIIVNICNEKNIPYVGIERNPDLFEMQDCPVKCENCIKHQNAIKNML